MNSLNTGNNGGFPFVLDDLRWMQNATSQVFKNLLKPLEIAGFNVIILQGCGNTNTGLNTTIDAGIISINGEICQVSAHSIVTPIVGQFAFWSILETFDPSGTKLYQDGLTHEAYAIREGKVVVAGALPLDAVTIGTELNYFAQLRTGIQSKSPAWTVFDSFIDPPAGFFPGQTIERKGLIDVDGFARLDGFNYADGPSINDVAFTLPEGFRPIKNRYCQIVSIDGSVQVIEIKTTGQVVWKVVNSGSLSVIYLDQIPFFRV